MPSLVRDTPTDSSPFDSSLWHRPGLYARGTRALIQTTLYFSPRGYSRQDLVSCVFLLPVSSIYRGLQAPLDSFSLRMQPAADTSAVNTPALSGPTSRESLPHNLTSF